MTFAPGKTATVELDARNETPPIVPSFRFDERTGRWNEQTTQWQSAGPKIITGINWLDWWNADQAYDTTCLKVQVLGCRGCEGDSVGVSGANEANVTATGGSYTEVATTKQTTGGVVCLPAKKGAVVRLSITSGGYASNDLVVNTDANALDPANCTNCPLVTATHAVAAPIVQDLLTAPNASLWCASHYWNGSTTEFDNSWRPTTLSTLPSTSHSRPAA